MRIDERLRRRLVAVFGTSVTARRPDASGDDAFPADTDGCSVEIPVREESDES